MLEFRLRVSRLSRKFGEGLMVLVPVWMESTIVRQGAETDGRRDVCARGAMLFAMYSVPSAFIER